LSFTIFASPPASAKKFAPLLFDLHKEASAEHKVWPPDQARSASERRDAELLVLAEGAQLLQEAELRAAMDPNSADSGRHDTRISRVLLICVDLIQLIW